MFESISYYQKWLGEMEVARPMGQLKRLREVTRPMGQLRWWGEVEFAPLFLQRISPSNSPAPSMRFCSTRIERAVSPFFVLTE